MAISFWTVNQQITHPKNLGRRIVVNMFCCKLEFQNCSNQMRTTAPMAAWWAARRVTVEGLAFGLQWSKRPVIVYLQRNDQSGNEKKETKWVGDVCLLVHWSPLRFAFINNVYCLLLWHSKFWRIWQCFLSWFSFIWLQSMQKTAFLQWSSPQ